MKKKLGLCIKEGCDNPIDWNRSEWLCSCHCNYHMEWATKRRKTRYENGECIQCGESLDRNGAYCNKCIKLHRMNFKEKYWNGLTPDIIDDELNQIKKYLKELKNDKE